MRKITILAFISLFILTACTAQDKTNVLNSNRTDIEDLQQSFRDSILSKYEEEEISDVPTIADASDSPAANKRKPADASDSPAANKRKPADASDLMAWRKEIGESWTGLRENQLDSMCEFFFAGIIDESSALANTLESVRKQLADQGVEIYSVKEIKLIEDNRETIQFPTKDFSSSIFVCSAQIVLKLSSGNYTQPLNSTLSAIYYLSGTEKKFTFQFKVKS